MTKQSFNMDAYAPAEMARRVETVGVAKANLDAATMFALATAAGIYLSQQWTFDAYQVGATAVKIAVAKVSYGFLPAFVLGVFCNALVCLAVWLCFSARTTTDKMLAIIPQITAFVAAVYWFVYLRGKPGNRVEWTWRHLTHAPLEASSTTIDQGESHQDRYPTYNAWCVDRIDTTQGIWTRRGRAMDKGGQASV
jgi:hypothetical protein